MRRGNILLTRSRHERDTLTSYASVRHLCIQINTIKEEKILKNRLINLQNNYMIDYVKY